MSWKRKWIRNLSRKRDREMESREQPISEGRGKKANIIWRYKYHKDGTPKFCAFLQGFWISDFVMKDSPSQDCTLLVQQFKDLMAFISAVHLALSHGHGVVATASAIASTIASMFKAERKGTVFRISQARTTYLSQVPHGPPRVVLINISLYHFLPGFYSSSHYRNFICFGSHEHRNQAPPCCWQECSGLTRLGHRLTPILQPLPLLQVPTPQVWVLRLQSQAALLQEEILLISNMIKTTERFFYFLKFP
ncbi:unnamed protein product [Nyctereutes procyonoides]|uniref:(raccoon dog) hypothetical protein n=1 Tax=Nyctereutes procyonoides TaxID=34880 RepID=A0A811YS34_NYCPR|nr:unnamed protein product [Nyctereutes procyonoides]